MSSEFHRTKLGCRTNVGRAVGKSPLQYAILVYTLSPVAEGPRTYVTSRLLFTKVYDEKVYKNIITKYPFYFFIVALV